MVYGLVYSSVVVDENLVVVGERYDGDSEIVDVGCCATCIGLAACSCEPTMLNVEERRFQLHTVAVERVSELAQLCRLAVDVAFVVTIRAAWWLVVTLLR